MPILTTYLLFFLSGISGLVYQVIWVREFGDVFGNTVHSAAIVTAVFMGGLGLGSLLVGRYSDRRHAGDPVAALRAYGLFELVIGALGLAVALVLPRLEGLSASLSAYGVGPEGWFELTTASYLVRYFSALALLLPITFLMGGTLTLLIRFVVAGHLSEAGWRVGVLYGLNTAGAALGAFATDFALVPTLGIFRTELCAIALNLIAGAGALVLARGPSRSSPTAAPAESVAPHSPASWDTRILGTAATLFATGFVAMGFEIVWFRYLISLLGGYRAIFSLLMTVILLGIFFGSILGGALERRIRRPVALFLAAQTVFIVGALAPMALLGPTVFVIVDPGVVVGGSAPDARSWIETAVTLPSIVAVVGLGALLMGCTFPLGNAHVQRVEASLGGRAGALYLANTLGNVVGSLVTAFLLLPALGQQGSVGFLTLCAAVGLVPLYLTVRNPSESGERVPLAVFAACLGILLASFVGWRSLPEHHLLKHVHGESAASQGARVVAISEGINESALVLERLDGRALYTNGHPMSANDFAAQRYMRLFSHVPLLAMEAPKSLLVICFGVGTTLHAASLHASVDRLDIADLSKNVLRQAHHFANANDDVIEDPRVSVYINDGRQHLRMQPPETYDLITLEPPPIAHAGVASLYSREFYELARSRLTNGGFMTQWLPIYQVSPDVGRSIIRAFLDVFPNAALLSGEGRELILIGSTGTDPFLDPSRVRERLERDPALRADLEAIGAGSLTALAATFVAGPLLLDRATSAVPAVTDDFPVMEYSRGLSHVRTRLPADVFDPWELRTWCPDCYEGREPIAELRDLPRLMDALEAWYQSDAFLDFSNILAPAALPYLPGKPCGLGVVEGNPYFQRVFGCRRPPSLRVE